MDLQRFYYLQVPRPVMTLKEFTYLNDSKEIFNPLGISYERFIQAWSEHDAIHYLLNLPFNVDGEKQVAHVEEHCQIGFFQIDESYNRFVKTKRVFEFPKGFGRLKILETAEQLRNLY